MVELVFLGTGQQVVYYHCDTLEKGVCFACSCRGLKPLGYHISGYHIIGDITEGAQYQPQGWQSWRQLVNDLRRHFPDNVPVSFPARNFFLDGYDYFLHEIVGEYGLMSLQKVS
jgi:hypothetical protein